MPPPFLLLIKHRSLPLCRRMSPPTKTIPWLEQYLDDTMRIVRLRGPKFEGRLNIFARRHYGNSNDDDNDDGDDTGVDGAQASTEAP